MRLETMRLEWGVESLSIENGIDVQHPTPEQANSAVESLNGDDLTDLIMIGTDDSSLLVSGDPEHHYLQINYEIPTTYKKHDGGEIKHNNRSFMLCNPEVSSTKELEIIAGGVRTPIAANMLVDKKTVIAAVAEYLKNGGLAPSLKWIEVGGEFLTTL